MLLRNSPILGTFGILNKSEGGGSGLGLGKLGGGGEGEAGGRGKKVVAAAAISSVEKLIFFDGACSASIETASS